MHARVKYGYHFHFKCELTVLNQEVLSKTGLYIFVCLGSSFMAIDLLVLRKVFGRKLFIPEQTTKVNKKMTFTQLAMDKAIRINNPRMIEVAGYKNPHCT